MARLSNEQYRALTAEKVAAAQELVAAEVAGLVNGEDWRRFLDDNARFYDLDATNTMLVVAQHRRAYEEGRVPDSTSTYVASFDTWKALGRHVERGQHGYTVLAAVRSVRADARGHDGDLRVLRRGGQAAAGETETTGAVVRGVQTETVFAASQTVGPDLAMPSRPTLATGDAPPGLTEAVKALIEERGWKVSTVSDATLADGANGRTYYGGRFVTLRDTLDDAETARALLHQAAHVLLHGGPPGRYLAHPVKEVEADSVAYVVGAVHGMATDGSRFPDVATWADNERDKTVRETQARVTRAAQAIIACSPAEHLAGSKPPGADLALAAMQEIDREEASRRAALGGWESEPAPISADGPGVA